MSVLIKLVDNGSSGCIPVVSLNSHFGPHPCWNWPAKLVGLVRKFLKIVNIKLIYTS